MATQLSEKARAFMQERRFAVLGTLNADGSPQMTIMWYLLEGDTIVMNTMIGRLKDRNLRRDPRISLCIPDGYNYVTVSGTAELIDDPEIAQYDIYRLAVRYDGEEDAKQQMEGHFSKEPRETIHLKIQHVIEHF
jgi:PPOX class probable F420-dependent enzyme